MSKKWSSPSGILWSSGRWAALGGEAPTEEGQRQLGRLEETGMSAGVPSLQTPSQHHLLHGVFHGLPKCLPQWGCLGTCGDSERWSEPQEMFPRPSWDTSS